MPSYEIVKRDGEYTDKETERFKQVVEQGAAILFKYASEGGWNIKYISIG